MNRKLRDPIPGERLPYGQGSYNWDKRDPAGKRQRRIYRYQGQPIDVVGYSWAEVERKRIEAILDIDAETERGLDPATVADMCHAWLLDASRLNRARKTRDGWLAAVRIIEAELGDKLCIKLNPARVSAFYLTLVDRPALLRSVHYIFGMICQHGRLHGRLAIDPQVKMPEIGGSIVKEAKDVNGYTLDEYRRVVPYLIEHHSTTHAFYLTMLLTGMRPGEAAGLCWDAVNFKAGTIEVRRTMRIEEGGRQLSSRLKTDHKTAKAHRTIPLAPELRAVLLREATEQLAAGTRTDRIFASVGRTYHKSGRRIAEGAGVRYITANGYRHTFGAIALHAGNDLHAVAALMGHNDLTMITKVYSHLVIKPADIDITKFVGLGAVAHD
jgi:integrase